MRLSGLLAPFVWRLAGGSLCMGLLAAAGALHAYLTGPLVQLVLTSGTSGLDYFAPMLPGAWLSGAQGEGHTLAAVAGLLVVVAAVKGGRTGDRRCYWMGRPSGWAAACGPGSTCT